VGDDYKLVQGWPAEDGIEGVVDLQDIEEDTLRAVVLRHPESHREGDATVQDDRAQTTLENGREGASLDMGIYNFW
jgi:hypothetical protein